MDNNFLWNRVLRFISKRERCEKEIDDYILRISKNNIRKNPLEIRINQSDKETEIDQLTKELIDRLKKLDFLNEERYTKAYIHDNYHLKHKGKNRIRHELTNKQIDESTIDKYLDEIGKENEAEVALELAKKRRQFMKKLPILTQKRRLYGLLVRRGFSPRLALDIVDSLVKKE